MRRRLVVAAAALALLAGGPAGATGATVPLVLDPLADGAPAPTREQLEQSVRDLVPAVRELVPQVRELRTEERDQGTTTVTISNDVLFDFGSAALTPRALEVLAELVPRLGEGEVRVVGHTDGIGSPEVNQPLSEQRAAAVAEALTARAGRPLQLVVEGRGSTEPVADEGGDDDTAARALNRRVTIAFAER